MRENARLRPCARRQGRWRSAREPRESSVGDSSTASATSKRACLEGPRTTAPGLNDAHQKSKRAPVFPATPQRRPNSKSRAHPKWPTAPFHTHSQPTRQPASYACHWRQTPYTTTQAPSRSAAPLPVLTRSRDKTASKPDDLPALTRSRDKTASKPDE